MPITAGRSFHKPLVDHLENLGMKCVVQETRIEEETPDIYFSHDSGIFLIQVKIGAIKEEICADVRGADNVVVLNYPKTMRMEVPVDSTEWRRTCLNADVDIFIRSEFLAKTGFIRPSKTPVAFLNELKRELDALSTSTREISTIIPIIKSDIVALEEMLNRAESRSITGLLNEVVRNLEAFVGLIQDPAIKKDFQDNKALAISIAAYLLVNQLILYQLYKINSGKPDKDLPPLDPKSPDLLEEITCSFKIIQKDYESVFIIDLVPYLPRSEAFLAVIKKIVENVMALPASALKHDLYGKLFHEIIPERTRKVIAAFYTRPIAAEILARLTIESSDDTILDPACGSGTLLVACYKQKRRLFDSALDETPGDPKPLKEIHNVFLEEQITGLDMMPFAIHLTSLNLSGQNILEKARYTRTAVVGDSLDLDNLNVGYTVQPFKMVMETQVGGSKKGKAVPADPESRDFKIFPVKRVIMNPPFTDKEKMPREDRDRLLRRSTLTARCGTTINLWGFFMALAPDLVTSDGTISAVIPINVFRGDDTSKLRSFFFNLYYPKYIIKSVVERAFSEDSVFKDVAIVFKKKTGQGDATKIVFLKKRLAEMNASVEPRIIEQFLKSSADRNTYFGDMFEARTIDPALFSTHIDNMMPLVYGMSLKNQIVLEAIWKLIETRGNRYMAKFNPDHIQEGIGLRPEGINSVLAITKPSDPSRKRHAKLVLASIERREEGGSENPVDVLVFRRKEDTYITELRRNAQEARRPFHMKDYYSVEKSKTRPFLRTFTGLKTVDVSDSMDSIIIEDYADLDELIGLSKMSQKPSPRNTILRRMAEIGRQFTRYKCHIAIPDKLDVTSDNTYFMCYYSEDEFIPNNMGYSFTESYATDEDYQAQMLFLNSVVLMMQFLRYKSETLGITRMKKEDWQLTKILALDKISLDKEAKQKGLLDERTTNEKAFRKEVRELYGKIRSVPFPSITQQYKGSFSHRVEIDLVVLRLLLGLEDRLLRKILKRVYAAIADELQKFKDSLSMADSAVASPAAEMARLNGGNGEDD